MRYLGLHLVGAPSEVVVNSNSMITSVHGSVQRDSLRTPMTQKVGFIVESRAVSEPGTGTGWDHIDGRRWGNRDASDPGVEMPDAQHEDNNDESARG